VELNEDKSTKTTPDNELVALSYSVSLNSLIRPYLHRNETISRIKFEETTENVDSTSQSIENSSHRFTCDYVKCSNSKKHVLEAKRRENSKLIQYIDDEEWSKFSSQDGKSVRVNLENFNNNNNRQCNVDLCMVLKSNQAYQNEISQRNTDEDTKGDFNLRNYLRGMLKKVKIDLININVILESYNRTCQCSSLKTKKQNVKFFFRK
jgi:hypothetical protein